MKLQRQVLNVISTAALFLAYVGEASATKTHALKVRSGVLTIDGLTARTPVDLSIISFHYLYIYVPGSGTAVISEQPFSGAREQKAAFHGNSMTILAGGRHLQLSAANRLRGTHSAYVRFDRGVGPGLRVPAIGYGDAAIVPAIWPEEELPGRASHLRVKVKGHRAMRTGKLCRPSPHGRELCATISEIAFQH